MKGDLEQPEVEFNEIMQNSDFEHKIKKLNEWNNALKSLKSCNYRPLLLFWVTKKSFGFKKCNSDTEAYSLIKKWNITNYSLIEGYIYTGNLVEEKAYRR